GERAQVWCQNVLDLDLDAPVDVIFSTATLHWVRDHERLWPQLARALRPGGALEVQCGGAGNLARVRKEIEAVQQHLAPELAGWLPWEFATPEETEGRLRPAWAPVRRLSSGTGARGRYRRGAAGPRYERAGRSLCFTGVATRRARRHLEAVRTGRSTLRTWLRSCGRRYTSRRTRTGPWAR